ncbi:9882_t:CDS:2 [Funneliformis geosporum]|nr:9882_t:CDS:2 [Funneliformis geosporum]
MKVFPFESVVSCGNNCGKLVINGMIFGHTVTFARSDSSDIIWYGYQIAFSVSYGFKCFQKTSNDYPIAQLYLGRCYTKGFGTEANYELAFHWYQKAAKSGNIFAFYNLTTSYYYGIGTEKNIETALYYYQKAAKREYRFAQCNNNNNSYFNCGRTEKGLENNIHHQGIVHRDFHSGNILCENENDIIISDLGISKLLIESNDNNCVYYGIIPYVAPEIFQLQTCTKASDIYSFGIIMWELMTGRKPFWDRKWDIHLIIEIHDGIRPPIITDAPEGYIELMQKCWDSNPNERPTAKFHDDLIESYDIDASSKRIKSNEETCDESINTIYFSKSLEFDI